MCFLKLGGVDLSEVKNGIQWMDSAKDITLMLRLNKSNQVDEQILTDGTFEVQYEFAYEGRQVSSSNQPLEHRVGLVIIKNANYVFCRHGIYVQRDLRLESVLGAWLGIEPPPVSIVGEEALVVG